MFCASVGCLCLLLAAPACSHYRAATTMRSNNLRTYEGTMRGKCEVAYLGCGASDLEIASYTSVNTGEAALKFTAEAGHVYLIGTKVEKAEEAEEGGKAAFILNIFIKDTQTKQVIAEDKREFIK